MGKGKTVDSVKAEEAACVLDNFSSMRILDGRAALSIILLFLRWRLADSRPRVCDLRTSGVFRCGTPAAYGDGDELVPIVPSTSYYW